MRTEVGRRFPPIRGTTRAPGVGPGLNKARTADCPPPLCRVRNRRPRAAEGRDTDPLRPQRVIIGRNSLACSRGFVSARTAPRENTRSHEPMRTESALTGPCGLTRSMTSPKDFWPFLSGPEGIPLWAAFERVLCQNSPRLTITPR